ncbi:MFS transporter [Streptacidiphilus pinicola]|uniref:MFS transporter n=2 Tax=Streptacidiphilus pinicola TaxID=2219663 RepID=A0A2X0JE36_9ACTN|nr:MFS transporter [Streptacidiphilus pinicola]
MTDEAQDAAPRWARLLFRNRDYTGWWVGETISDFGSALSLVAFPLLVLVQTGSAAGAGTVEAAAGIGGLVTMLLGGALADRFSRRAILVASPLVQAAAVGSVATAVAAGHVSMVHLGVAGFVQGLADGVAGGAWFATLCRVVPEEQRPTAFAQMQGRRMAIRLAGPSAGGFLFGLARWVPFLGDAVSFLVGATGAFLIRRPLGPDPEERGTDESVLASIGAGMRYIAGSAYLRFLTVWAAVANACNAGLLLLVIVLIQHRHGSPLLVGAVGSLGAVGGLAGALLSRRIAERVPGRAMVIVISWISAAVVVGIAFVPTPWMIGALLAAMLFLAAPLNVVFSTYEAKMIPDALLGRVTSAINFGAASIRWLGAIAAGALASAFGATTATLCFAGVLAVVAIGTLRASGLYVLSRPIDELSPSAE